LDFEKKFTPIEGAAGFECRDDDEPKIIGYGIVYDRLSEVIGGFFKEKIMPGAAAEVLKNSDLRSFFNHDPNYVLGREKSGTLKVKEDEIGVKYTVKPPDADWARGLMSNIKRGDIDGSSFIFGVKSENVEWDESGEIPIRMIHKIDQLVELGPVTLPAYSDSTSLSRAGMAIRSADEIINEYKNKRKNRKLYYIRKKMDILDKKIGS